MDRRVLFVKYYDKGSTVIGADQMSCALRAQGVDAASVYASDLDGVRDSILVFVKRANWPHLLRARLAGNRCVLDVQDQVVFRTWISHWPLYDAFLFRTERQRRDFGRQVRRMGNLWALQTVIYQHWDPRYGPHRVPEGELRVGYVGTRRSFAFWEELPEVRCLGPDDWFDGAHAFNAHVSVRTTRRGWRYKPGAKVVTAAACDAVLVTTPDDASVELLGEGYPYYVSETTAESVRATLRRAEAEVGGPVWRAALERLRTVRGETRIERTAERYLELFDALA